VKVPMLGVKVQGSGGSGDWYLGLAVPVGRTTATICPLPVFAGMAAPVISYAWVGVTDDRVVTLELDPRHAEVARANVAAAGLGDLVEVRVGAAATLMGELQEPFDLVFIDADKASTPGYFGHALRLSHPGSVIVVDNVVRGGAVVDGQGDDADLAGIRRFAELVRLEPRVRATAIQTVGRKGYDGFALVYVEH